MNSTGNERGNQRVGFGCAAIALMGALSLAGCKQPENQTQSTTPAVSTSQSGTQDTSRQTVGSETGAGSNSANSRDENSRPLNPEKFGSQ